MFQFTREPSSGSRRQYLAKITHLVQYGYVDLVRGLLEKYPTFGREKETGLPGALDT